MLGQQQKVIPQKQVSVLANVPLTRLSYRLIIMRFLRKTQLLWELISKNFTGYTQEQSTYCTPDLVRYSSVADATVACDLDKQCKGFYHYCGNANIVYTCGPNLNKLKSSCGSLFYEKPNHQASKIIIQLETMISWLR